MKGLIICEESQAVTKAFRKKGHEFYSNDLQECSGGYPEWHIQENCFRVLSSSRFSIGLDFLGAHPDCTYLTNAGVRWLASRTERLGYEWSDKYQIYINAERFRKMEMAAIFFKSSLENVKRVGKGYVENPIMHKYAMEIIGIQPSQIIHPWMFGHLEQKATCMWYVNLPNLVETDNVYDKMILLPYKERAKVHYESPGADRSKRRSATYFGVAYAMAEQWG
jgi:hypothetical protein